MTAENKKTIKILAISVGIILVVTVVAVLIIQHINSDKDTKDKDEPSRDPDTVPKTTATSSGAASSSGSLNTFQGRTFAKADIEKMQSFLFNMGAMAMNDLIVNTIRNSGGIDGKIGNGFKTAYDEAIRIGIIKSLDDLYTQAMRF